MKTTSHSDILNKSILAATAFLFLGCTSTPKASLPLSTSNEKVLKIPVVSMDLAQANQSLCPKIGADLSKKKLKELIQMGNACMKASDYARLDEVGTNLNKIEAFQPWGAFFLSVAAEAKNELARAKWMIELALKKNASYGILHFQKGRLLWADKQYAEAIQVIRKAVGMDPGLNEGHLFLGQVYFRDQEFDQASEHFYTVLKAKPSHFVALSGLAESRMYRGDYRGALEVLNRGINYYPSAVEFQWRQAQIYESGLNDKINALNSYIQLKRKLIRNPSRIISLADVETKIQLMSAGPRQPAASLANEKPKKGQ